MHFPFSRFLLLAASASTALQQVISAPLTTTSGPEQVLIELNSFSDNGTTAFHLQKRAAAGFPAPSTDPFYQAPTNIGTYANGGLIRYRGVTTEMDATYTGASYQALYRTTQASGAADATVATVFVPRQPATSPKLLVFQIWEDSVQLDCNPSWALLQGSGSVNKGTIAYDAKNAIPWALSQGWYVVAPDYLGGSSAFLAGYTEGRAILDSARAVIGGLNLPKSIPIAMFGYSGSAHATAWAAELASSYASELNIVGAAYGGSPLDPRSLISTINRTQYSTYIILSLVGLAHAYSDFAIYLVSAISSFGQQVASQAVSPGICLYTLPNSWKYISSASLFTQGDAALNATIAKTTFAKESLLRGNVTFSTPKFPRYVYHGTTDQIAPYKDAAQYVKEACANGGNVKFVTYTGQDHFGASSVGSNDAGAWVQSVLNGVVPQNQCASPVVVAPPNATTTSASASSATSTISATATASNMTSSSAIASITSSSVTATANVTATPTTATTSSASVNATTSNSTISALPTSTSPLSTSFSANSSTHTTAASSVAGTSLVAPSSTSTVANVTSASPTSATSTSSSSSSAAITAAAILTSRSSSPATSVSTSSAAQPECFTKGTFNLTTTTLPGGSVHTLGLCNVSTIATGTTESSVVTTYTTTFTITSLPSAFLATYTNSPSSAASDSSSLTR